MLKFNEEKLSKLRTFDDVLQEKYGEPTPQALLESAMRVLPADRVWVNPDCGLKTRGWVETEASLRHLVEAARQVRASL